MTQQVYLENSSETLLDMPSPGFSPAYQSFLKTIESGFEEHFENITKPQFQKFIQKLETFLQNINEEEKSLAKSKLEALKNVFSILLLNSFRSQNTEDSLSPSSGLAETPEGDLVVVDDFNHRIQIYDSQYNLKITFGSKGKETGQFLYPKGVAVDADGFIYVADSWNHRVQKFNRRGEFQFTFGNYGEGKGQLNEPYDISIDESKSLLIVVERSNHRVQFFRNDGSSLGWIGSRGSLIEDQLATIYETPLEILSKPTFEFPSSITLDSLGNYYITDSSNHRILKFDSEWQNILTIGEKGQASGQFLYPMSITCCPNGLLYVADQNNDRIQVFTHFGHWLMSIKYADKETPLKMPSNLLVDSEGNLIVGLTFNTTLFKFQTPSKPLTDIYQNLVLLQPKNLEFQFGLGQCFLENKNPQKSYDVIRSKCLPLIDISVNLEKSQNFRDLQSISKHLLKLIQKLSFEENNETLFLELQNLWNVPLESLRDKILDYKNEVSELTQNLIKEEQEKNRLVMEDRLNPLSYNEKLHDLNIKSKKLFYYSRKLFFDYREHAQNFNKFYLQLIELELSDTSIKKILEEIGNNYRTIGNLIKNLLKEKETNEEKLVHSLQEIDEGNKKLIEFHTKSEQNIKINEVIKHFLFEFQITSNSLRTLTQMYSDKKFVGEWFKNLILESKSSTLFPRIILGFQENPDTQKVLSREYKNLLDIWIKNWADEIPLNLNDVSESQFIPIPYDTESLDSKKFMETQLSCEMPIQTESNGIQWGANFFQNSFLENKNEFLIKLEGMLGNLVIYQKQMESIFPQYKEITSQKPDLEEKARRVDVRDSKTPILMRNNILILDFQAQLLLRMYHTLEVNELNNLNWLIAGCSLLISEHPDQKTSSNWISNLNKKKYFYLEKLKEYSQLWKTSGLKKVELDSQYIKASQSKDLGQIGEMQSLQKELVETNTSLLQAEKMIFRFSNIINLFCQFDSFLDKSKLSHTPTNKSLAPWKFSFSFGSFGHSPGFIILPFGVTHLKNGDFLVADHVKHELIQFSQSGLFLNSFGRFGNGLGALNKPYSVTQDIDNNILVVDFGNQRIQRYDSHGKFLNSLGQGNSSEHSIGTIYSCSTDPEGNVWVADFSNHRILVYSGSGQWIKTFDASQNSSTDLKNPMAISCLANGNFVVGDQSKQRLKLFDSQGNLLHLANLDICSLDEFLFINYDPKWGIFVSDAWNCRVVQYNDKLELQQIYENKGTRIGQMLRTGNLSIYKDQLVVSDFDNSRLQVFNLT